MPNGTVSGCFLLVALVVDATLPLRWLYKVGSLDTMDVDTNTSLGAAQCVNALVDIIRFVHAGLSQSQSQPLLVSSSQLHTSTCASLCSLGIGIDEAERGSHHPRMFLGWRNSGSTLKRQQ